MDSLDAYLDELVSHLDCDPLRRDEIRLEVHAYLQEAVDAHLRHGMNAAEAKETATKELGAPESVARRLACSRPGAGMLRPASVALRALAVAIAWLVAWGLPSQVGSLARGVVIGFAEHFHILSDSVPLCATLVALVALFLSAVLPAAVLQTVSRKPRDAWFVCLLWAGLFLSEAFRAKGSYPGELFAELGIFLLGMMTAAYMIGRFTAKSDRLDAGSRATDSSGADDIDRYVAELVSHLDCDPLRRDEIRLEVHAHLRELAEALGVEGMTPAAAAEAAVGEFGPVGEVARRLAAANGSRLPRLLPPAPFGTRAGAVAFGWLAYFGGAAGVGLLARHLLGISGRQAIHETLSLRMVIISVAAQLLAGALAAFLVWLVSRRPWDALLICPITALYMAFMVEIGWARLPSASPYSPYPLIAAETSALLIGVTVVVLLLSGRRVRPSLFGRGL